MRTPDIIVKGLDKAESLRGHGTVTLLVNGDEGWDERVVDLDAVVATLAGTRTPVKKDSIASLIRSQKKEIAKAKRRGLSWQQISDAYAEHGIPIDSATLRKVFWQVCQEKN